jgi:hypothetical protein
MRDQKIFEISKKNYFSLRIFIFLNPILKKMKNKLFFYKQKNEYSEIKKYYYD